MKTISLLISVSYFFIVYFFNIKFYQGIVTIETATFIFVILSFIFVIVFELLPLEEHMPTSNFILCCSLIFAIFYPFYLLIFKSSYYKNLLKEILYQLKMLLFQ